MWSLLLNLRCCCWLKYRSKTINTNILLENSRLLLVCLSVSLDSQTFLILWHKAKDIWSRIPWPAIISDTHFPFQNKVSCISAVALCEQMFLKYVQFGINWIHLRLSNFVGTRLLSVLLSEYFKAIYVKPLLKLLNINNRLITSLNSVVAKWLWHVERHCCQSPKLHLAEWCCSLFLQLLFGCSLALDIVTDQKLYSCTISFIHFVQLYVTIFHLLTKKLP